MSNINRKLNINTLLKSAKYKAKAILPKQVLRLVQRYLYWRKFRLKEELKNLELKEKHSGSRAFIIGNGPSILKQDLTLLSNEITFVLNSFFHHDQYEQINPTYLCSCDPSLNDAVHRKAWYELQKEKTKQTIKLFSKQAEIVDLECNLFQDHLVYYIHTPAYFVPPLYSLEHCPTDLTKPLASHGLVFIDIAMLAACYMGIKEIYLLGMDGGEIKSLDDYINYNFYGADPLFSLEQYEDSYETFFVDKQFQSSREGLYEKSIACISKTFEKNNIKIFNATLQGFEMGFKRIKFEDIFK